VEKYNVENNNAIEYNNKKRMMDALNHPSRCWSWYNFDYNNMKSNEAWHNTFFTIAILPLRLA